MRRYRIYLFLSFLFLFIVGAPVNGQRLTLSHIINRVLETNPELQSLQNQVKAKEGALLQAGAFLNPDIGAIGGNRVQMVEFEQTIEYPSKRRARVNLYGTEVQIAALELKQAQIKISAQVAALFCDVLWAEKDIDLLKENLRITQRLFEAARSKFDQGFGSKLDIVKGQVEVIRAKRLLVAARQEFLIKRQDLILLLKQDKVDSLRLEGDSHQSFFSKAVNLDSLIAYVVRTHPAMRVEEQRLQAAQYLAQSVYMSTKPDFNFTLAGGKEEFNGRIEVGLSIPLVLWDRKRGAKSEALSEQKSAKFQLENRRLEITRQVNAAFQNYQAAKESVLIFEDTILQEARSVADSALQAYASTSFRFLDLIDAQRTFTETAQEYNNTLHDLRLAEIELKASAGMFLSGGEE